MKKIILVKLVKTMTNNYINEKRIRSTYSTSETYSPRNKGIGIVEDRQLVPPSLPAAKAPRTNSEWIAVGRRGKPFPVVHKAAESQPSSAGTPVVRNRKRSTGDSASVVKFGRRLIKSAVVAITNKPGGASYAEILAKARERMSLKDLGIQDTVIRRAMNGAIVIEVPRPHGKQLASTLSNSLAAALGKDAKVLHPVAMGELRMRGIDTSTSADEVRAELELLDGCSSRDIKVSSISSMRDGMGVA